jgi:hypothetical protein
MGMKHLRGHLLLPMLILVAMFSASAFADFSPHDEKPASFPFSPSEELVYDCEFSRSLMRGLNVAELRSTASQAAQASASLPSGLVQNPLQFKLEVTSKGLLNKLFGLNFHQLFNSTVDPKSFAVRQTVKLDEQGKRRRTSEALFDGTARKVVWTERDPNDTTRPPRVVTNEINGAVQDIASAFYFLRTQPLETGKNFEIEISDSGQVYHTPIKVIEKKSMKTILGTVNTLRVEPEIFGTGRLIAGKGQMVIWLTDDARHIPVRARLNNSMGTLDLKLKSINGNAKTKV